jgi:glycosyltransferase involved in cell wall biosynthesis
MPGAPPLVLVGKPLTEEVMDAIRARGLGARIAAFSGVTDLDLAALYSSAALLLFPSLAEGFGWPVAEAMACGCRVVTSGRAPMTEIAGDAATYIDPEDHAAAAATIEMVLMESEGERRARVAAGLARAARFSGRAMATAYLAVYQEVLGARPNAA